MSARAPVEGERFVARPLERVTTTLFYSRQAGFVVLDPSMGLDRLLGEWSRFDDLEHAAVTFLGEADVSEALVRLPGARWAARLGLRPWLAKALLEARVRQLRSGGQDGRVARVTAELRRLAAAGVLVSYSELVKRAGGGEPPSRPLRRLAVATRDDPERLGRCLRSFVENAASFGRSIEVHVMDDSASAQQRAASRKVLADVAQAYGAEAYYGDRETRETFVERLAGLGAPAESLRFALLGGSGPRAGFGAERNALLLAAGREPTLMIDHSAECVVFRRSRDDRDAWVAGNAPGAEEGSSAHAGDFWAAHEALLGRPLNDAFERVHQAADPRPGELCRHLVDSLDGGGGTVAATSTGIVPSSSAARHGRLASVAWPRGAAWADRGAAAATTISHRRHWATPVLGLDTRFTLPPFMPGSAAESVGFGDVFVHVFDDLFPVELDLAVPYSEGLSGRTPTRRPWMHEILSACVATSGETGRWGPERRLARLGRCLHDLAALDPADFEDDVRLRMLRYASETAGRGQHLLGELLVPRSSGSREVRPLAELTIPIEAPCGGSRDGAIGELQRTVSAYGQLLCSWTAIAAAAEQLRAATQTRVVRQL